ncbi:MAG: tRNA (adenosine(37)-N6)-threonylcarbamoyltransferase complex ATPase subunit type 1 TsaE [Paludibacteraceae bacterium]|jgi:tRNA threonylcarbamoyladenosine biosynthesis protein TsaE|nr:tRNA (adenosine(37)-N6)-threonylcarbamoyltransferase complex ATPase subunit type 1 TsaE [Paludibacteraceae bacterium]MCR5297935.1 tRNA (adenosine(37)-N6)-threonylcarbamoyltransferase complex ATPase subunit type 1 TsaE [Paludibacteraceae bacterium]
MKLTLPSLEQIEQAARKFLELIGDHRVLAFYGSMGAGKTTFIKAVCHQLGVKETVASPTFAIVNEYLAGDGEAVYHFDFYRIKNEEEAIDFGCEDYFYSGRYCFIEWPERILSLLPEETLEINIRELPDGTREIDIPALP